MAGPLLSVRNLRVEFATRNRPLVAVDDISFDIAPGEFVGRQSDVRFPQHVKRTLGASVFVNLEVRRESFDL